MLNIINKNEHPEIKKEKFQLVKNNIKESEKISGTSLGYWQDSFRRLLQNKLATFCLFFVIIVFLFSIVVKVTSPYSTVTEPIISDPNKPGELIGKARLTKLPPRIKGLEWTPWFSGKISKNVPKIVLTDKDDPSYYMFKDKTTYTIKSCKVDKTGIEMCDIEQDVYKLNNVKQLYFPFGTDHLARDLWTRVWNGIFNSLLIAFTTAFFDIVIGVIYGSIAGFYAGTKIDNFMMRFTEIYGSIPSIVLLILLLSFMQRGMVTLIIAMALTGWIGVARVVRAQFLRYRDHDFVLASKTIGANNFRLIFKHIFPNIIGQIVILATFSIPDAIFYEATLSFIGLGLPVDKSSLGNLINQGIANRVTAPYILWIPTLILAIIMLAINLLANGLRDSLDPRLRGR